ncbi:MAG: type I-C CRISPR-associated protein Cas8c/Csd1 [Deltaproteobacteria bacterium]|nr:type I-C CRISPR-associated protein Cas8c/Csd1 [Deltaproteobacteria bacterium]
MLNHLVEYAKRLEDVEPGFKPKMVRWAAVFSESGEFLDVVEMGNVGAKKNPGRAFAKCPDLAQAELVGGNSPRCHFLIETAEVVALLYDKKTLERSGGTEKILGKHAFFIECLKAAERDLPVLEGITRFLATESDLSQLCVCLTEHKAAPSDKVTFQLGIGGPFVVESDAWHEWWRTFRGTLSTSKRSSSRGTTPCLVTGVSVEPAATHPKIEGLSDVGGSGVGTVLVGFDKDAFTSYGLEQSANAPMSEETANAYRAALNHLLKHQSRTLAGAKVVHWFKDKLAVEDDPLAWLVESEKQVERDANRRAAEMLSALRSGKRPDLAENRYFAMTLSGAGGRVMVRDWMEGSFEELVSNVNAWFDDLAIVHREGGRLAPEPKFLAVLGATVRELKDLPPPFVASMWRAAVRGGPFPQNALALALRRTVISIIGDDVPNHAGMGLMKAFHFRNQGGSNMSDLKPMLNEGHPAPAYHCGRLMAVLAAIQRAALGDVGAGVVQRYYAAASTTPALVLGRLVRTAQFHLGKLDAPGLVYWYEEKLSSVWGRIGDAPPRTLGLEEQSLFALGYYQQLADLRTKKPDEPAKKEEAHA